MSDGQGCPVAAVADPTHVRLLDTQTFKGICSFAGLPAWYPLHVGRDESTVFADLTPATASSPGSSIEAT